MSEIKDKLLEIDREMSPAPWCREWMHTAIRHLDKNCEIETDCKHDDYPYCRRPDRYDGGRITELRNLIPQIIEELSRLQKLAAESIPRERVREVLKNLFPESGSNYAAYIAAALGLEVGEAKS